MHAQPDHRTPLVAFRTIGAPELVTRKLFKSTLALTEIRGDADHGRTKSLPYDDAYLVQLRLRECKRCEYFSEGRRVEVADHGAGVVQLHDLRRDPTVELLDPFHVTHMYLPRRVLSGLAEEANATAFVDLHVEPGNSFRDPVLKGLLTALLPALANPEHANALFVDHAALAISAHVAQQYGGLRTEKSPRGGLAPWQARRAKDLLESDLGGSIQLEMVARECGISVRHFARAFRQTMGVPPYRYLLQRRIEMAETLLMNPGLSLPDIALRCGFADQSHFSRVFSASVGVSPGAWRRTRLRVSSN